MRLLYISSGQKTLSDLNPSIVSAFEELSKDTDGFEFDHYYTEQANRLSLPRKVEQFMPDYIVVFGHSSHNVVDEIKGYHIPIGLWVVNDPYSISNYDKLVSKFQFIITQDSGTIPYYEQVKKIPAIHTALAANPDNYYPEEQKYKYDICFVGNAWPGRIAFFNKIIPAIKKRNFILVGKGWNRLTQYNEIKDKIMNNTINPEEVSRLYNKKNRLLP